MQSLPGALWSVAGILRVLRPILSAALLSQSAATAPGADSPVTASGNYPSDVGIEKDPAVLFFEDFESGDFSKWDDFDGNPEPSNSLILQAGPFGGKENHAARLRVPEKERGSADLLKQLPKGYDRLYARWYILYEPGFNFDAPNHGGGLHAGSRDLLGRSGHRPRGDDWFSSWIEHTTDTHQHSAYTYYRGMYQDCADPNGQCWGDIFPARKTGVFVGKPQHQPKALSPVLETGKWYCVEILMDGGRPTPTEDGANGVLNYWIDGQEIGPWNGLWFRTSADVTIRILWLSLFHHDGTHSKEGILIDNVIVATQRIGPGHRE